MSKITRAHWAQAYRNDAFLLIETWSGYRGGHRRDYKGELILLAPDLTDAVVGEAVLQALAKSRWVLPEPQEGICDPEGVEFDSDLYNYKVNIERYVEWIKVLMDRYEYKTKRALFKDMENCHIAVKDRTMKIVPQLHTKLEQWEGLGPNDEGAVEIPADSSPAEIGAALRLAFARCKSSG